MKNLDQIITLSPHGKFELNPLEDKTFVNAQFLSLAEDCLSELVRYPQWVCWKKGRVKQDGKFDKVPFSPYSGQPISGSHKNGEFLKQAGTFQDALEGIKKFKADGLGFILSGDDPFVALDIDHCLENETESSLEPSKVIEKMDTYTEKSPSGNGLRLICKGKIPDWSKNKQGNFEAYDKSRFVTITGNIYGEIRPIRECQKSIDWFCLSFLGQKETEQNHNVETWTIPEPEREPRLKAAWQDPKILALMNGEIHIGEGNQYATRSEADFALCSKLAFYLGPDPDAIEEFALKSELYREKWNRKDGQYGTYLRRTIYQAIRNQTDMLQLPSRQADGQEHPSKFILVKAGELECPPQDWLLRNYIETNCLASVFGDPESGKSFFCIDLGCCVATGIDFHGLPVQSGPVVYIAGEGQNGILRRFLAWCKYHKMDKSKIPFYISKSPAEFLSQKSTTEVLQAIDHYIEENSPPKLVVIDTLARNFGPGDENKTQDMSAFIGAMDKIRIKYGCTVILVHHVGHTDKERARGAIALKAALDTEFRLNKDKNRIIRLEATKMKESELPDPLAFKFRTIGLGFTDEHGDEVMSAVLERTDYSPPPKKFGNQGRGKNQQLALDQLRRLYQKKRDELEKKGFDPDQAQVSEEEWHSACVPDKMQRQRWPEVKNSLINNENIKIENGCVIILID